MDSMSFISRCFKKWEAKQKTWNFGQGFTNKKCQPKEQHGNYKSTNKNVYVGWSTQKCWKLIHGSKIESQSSHEFPFLKIQLFPIIVPNVYFSIEDWFILTCGRGSNCCQLHHLWYSVSHTLLANGLTKWLALVFSTISSSCTIECKCVISSTPMCLFISSYHLCWQLVPCWQLANVTLPILLAFGLHCSPIVYLRLTTINGLFIIRQCNKILLLLKVFTMDFLTQVINDRKKIKSIIYRGHGSQTKDHDQENSTSQFRGLGHMP